MSHFNEGANNTLLFCPNVNCEELTPSKKQMKYMSRPCVHIIEKREWAVPVQCQTCNVIRYVCNIFRSISPVQQRYTSYRRSCLFRYDKNHNCGDNTTHSTRKRYAVGVDIFGSNDSGGNFDDPEMCIPVNVYDREKVIHTTRKDKCIFKVSLWGPLVSSWK